MIKHTQTNRRPLLTDCLSVFDHFVRLAIKGLTVCHPLTIFAKCLIVDVWQSSICTSDDVFQGAIPNK